MVDHPNQNAMQCSVVPIAQGAYVNSRHQRFADKPSSTTIK